MKTRLGKTRDAGWGPRLLLALAAGAAAAAGDGPSRTVQDLAGRTVTLPASVERVVAIGPGALRLVVYLGAADRVVGIEDMELRMSRDPWLRPYAGVLDEKFFRLPVVGPGGPGRLPDIERILLCRPDAIVTVSMDPAQVEHLQAKTGIPVVHLSYGGLGVWREQAQTSLTILGEVLGRQQRAGEVNAFIADRQRDLRERAHPAPDREPPAAYFAGLSIKGSQGWTSTEAGYPPGKMANARNVADTLGRTGHLFVDREQILLWNPDFLFVDVSSREILAQDFERDRAFYRLLQAVGAGRVRSLLPYNYYNTNIELALLNAWYIAKCLYPAQFGDLDIAAKAEEVFAFFFGRGPGSALPAYGPVTFPAEGPVQWGRP